MMCSPTEELIIGFFEWWSIFGIRLFKLFHIFGLIYCFKWIILKLYNSSHNLICKNSCSELLINFPWVDFWLIFYVKKISLIMLQYIT